MLQAGSASAGAVLSLTQLVRSPTVAVQVVDPLLLESIVGSHVVVVVDGAVRQLLYAAMQAV
jgi:hypothetical protein